MFWKPPTEAKLKEFKIASSLLAPPESFTSSCGAPVTQTDLGQSQDTLLSHSPFAAGVASSGRQSGSS